MNKIPCTDPDMARIGCADRSQCFEPCGELGHSLEHAKKATIVDYDFLQHQIKDQRIAELEKRCEALETEVSNIHRKYAAERLRADRGWERWESTNKSRIDLEERLIEKTIKCDELRARLETALLPATQPTILTPAQIALPRVYGVSRDAESPGEKGILVSFERWLTDNELRFLHNILIAWQEVGK